MTDCHELISTSPNSLVFTGRHDLGELLGSEQHRAAVEGHPVARDLEVTGCEGRVLRGSSAAITSTRALVVLRPRNSSPRGTAAPRAWPKVVFPTLV
jgi:hypothetical protein